MISVVIPSRNEQFLPKTVTDLLSKAKGEVEVIVNLDGYWPEVGEWSEDPRVTLLHQSEPIGMRPGINECVKVAKGDYLLKCDAHTMWDEGWDVKLRADMQDNWVMVPRRKRLEPETWTLQETGKPDIDYMYLAAPIDPSDWGGKGLNGKPWNELNRQDPHPDKDIVDLMSAQGSAWFMKKSYFHELELMDDKSYGKFWNEFQEIGLKCWLSGGRVVRNKKTWYAHLHKGKKYGRGYRLPEHWLTEGRDHTIKWMKFGEAWDKQTLPLEWLIEKFWPVPTWDEEWKDKYTREFRNSSPGGDSKGALPLPQRDKMIKSHPLQLNYIPTRWTPPTIKKDFKRWKDLPKFINEMGLKKGAEIGVSGARYSKQLAHYIEGHEMIGVDPYTTYEGYQWGGRQTRHDNHYEEALKRMEPYNYKLHRAYSEEIVDTIPDGSLDFVYIDGNHDFDHTMYDLIMWGKKVRKGGIISGDDYYEFRFGGVFDAVNAYVKAHGIEEWFLTADGIPSFFWVKK